jgi:small ligand-binding sensory domain FIST
MPPVVAARPACRFGDGLAIGPDLEGAGEVALAQALEPLGGVAPDLLCFFVAAGVPARPGAVEEAGRRVMDAAGSATTIGATAAGVFGNGRGVAHGPAVAIWAATLPGARMRPFRLTTRTTDGLPEVDLPPAENDDSAVALLVDPHTFPVAGFLRDNGTVPVVGGLASARGGPGSNRLFLDGEVHAHGGVGLLVGGGIRTRTLVSHGCRPIGPPMTVTRAERNVLLELAGAPALQRLSEVVDALPVPRRRAAARALQLGVVVDEYADEHARGDFLVRGILGADEMTGAVAVGDVIEVGRTVRFQVRDAGSAAEDLRAALPVADPATPSGALLFSCKARRSLFARPDHDARVVRDRLGGGAVAGLLAAGEIGPVGGRNHLHGNSTAVLALG